MTTEPSIGEMAESIESSLSAITELVTAGSYIAGFGFVVGSLLKFKQHRDEPNRVPVGTPVTLFFLGAALLFLPTLVDLSTKKKSGT